MKELLGLESLHFVEVFAHSYRKKKSDLEPIRQEIRGKSVF